MLSESRDVPHSPNPTVLLQLLLVAPPGQVTLTVQVLNSKLVLIPVSLCGHALRYDTDVLTVTSFGVHD
ncbi:hypothetical protein ANO14919_111350 [Xylariales sp. No.14919]|nr:hypothetical protein ANO14919_111350 [Xylariales sp. No.14919]